MDFRQVLAGRRISWLPSELRIAGHQVSADQTVFNVGDKPDGFYVVHEGTVEMRSQGSFLYARFGKTFRGWAVKGILKNLHTFS